MRIVCTRVVTSSTEVWIGIPAAGSPVLNNQTQWSFYVLDYGKPSYSPFGGGLVSNSYGKIRSTMTDRNGNAYQVRSDGDVYVINNYFNHVSDSYGNFISYTNIFI